jgi:hypothetical protein
MADPRKPDDTAFTAPGGGFGELFINRASVGRVAMPNTVLGGYSANNEMFNIGRDTGTTVSKNYKGPFAYKGVIDHVVITLK